MLPPSPEGEKVEMPENAFNRHARVASIEGDTHKHTHTPYQPFCCGDDGKMHTIEHPLDNHITYNILRPAENIKYIIYIFIPYYYMTVHNAIVVFVWAASLIIP